MNAEMKNGSSKRNAPFNRNWTVAAGVQRAEAERRFDVVVVCQRHERLQLQPALNLVGLEKPSIVRCTRRCPPGTPQVEFAPVARAIAAFSFIENPFDTGDVSAEPVNEIERFMRMQSMAVQRHASAKLPDGAFAPLQVEFGLLQDSVSLRIGLNTGTVWRSSSSSVSLR